MNSSTLAEDQQFAALWELDAPVRFPITPEDWDMRPCLPPTPRSPVVGQEAFDLLINHRARRPPASTMKKLITSYPDTFAAASVALKPHEWRTLHYLDQYPMAALGCPSFNGVRTLLEILNRDESLNDVPQMWTGALDPTACVLLDLRAVVSDLGLDVAKATWAILAFSRSLGMEKHEVLQLPWWSTWWISRFLSVQH